MTTIATSTVPPRRPAPTTIPATAMTPEITFFNSDVEVSYAFTREDGAQVGFVFSRGLTLPLFPLTVAMVSDDPSVPVEFSEELFGGKITPQLTLVVLSGLNLDENEKINLSYTEAKMLRALLNSDAVSALLDTAQ